MVNCPQAFTKKGNIASNKNTRKIVATKRRRESIIYFLCFSKIVTFRLDTFVKATY